MGRAPAEWVKCRPHVADLGIVAQLRRPLARAEPASSILIANCLESRLGLDRPGLVKFLRAPQIREISRWHFPLLPRRRTKALPFWATREAHSKHGSARTPGVEAPPLLGFQILSCNSTFFSPGFGLMGARCLPGLFCRLAPVEPDDAAKPCGAVASLGVAVLPRATAPAQSYR